jgi:hypothetical protein
VLLDELRCKVITALLDRIMRSTSDRRFSTLVDL